MDEYIKNEANKCLNCVNPSCVKACPLHNNIPGFIKAFLENDINKANEIIHNTSMLPSICSIVCPIEKQCVGNCIKNKLNDPVKVNEIENYIVKDYRYSFTNNKNDKRVAIIGSGPAGLSCAIKLNELGYNVDIFDKYNVEGGILTYGIPSFILDKNVVINIVDQLKEAKTNFLLNKELGKDIILNDLAKKYDAVFVAIGASNTNKMNVDGEDAINVIDANEFLENIYSNSFDSSNIRNVVVCGGGNSAIDAALSAKKYIKDSNVSIMYRRSEKEMPANKKEYNKALSEGIIFNFLTTPVSYVVNNNKAVKIEAINMKLVEVEGGRAKPIEIEGSNHFVDVDLVIEALGCKVNTNPISGLTLSKWNTIEVNEANQTNINNVFAGGDVVRGTDLVVTACLDGLNAAINIDKYLNGR